MKLNLAFILQFFIPSIWIIMMYLQVGNDHLYATKYTPSDWTNSNWTHYNKYVQTCYRYNDVDYVNCILNALNRDKMIRFLIYLWNSADQARNNSESIRNEGFRLIAEREDTTVKKQRDSDKRVGERLNDVSHWRSELQVMKSFVC